jgi:hypothetical protein
MTNVFPLQGEENESWKTEDSVKYTKDKSKSKKINNVEEEPPESVFSVESGANSDNSEDENFLRTSSIAVTASSSRQRDLQSTEQETPDGTDGAASESAFLFLGPLGMTLFIAYCRRKKDFFIMF